MGTYTASQGFYKPDPDEFVDVESQVNFNIRRADEKVRALVEWQYTEAPVISGSEPRDVGYKFFKASTNSLYTQKTATDFSQADSNGVTETWNNVDYAFLNSYQSVNDDEMALSYTERYWGNGLVRWRGGIRLNAGDEIPLNTSINVLQLSGIRIVPFTNKYFNCHMGDPTTGYSFVRILFGGDGVVSIVRQGSAMTLPAQRYISFNDISYSTNF